MKRILALMLSLIMAFSLAACGSKDAPQQNNDTEKTKVITDGTGREVEIPSKVSRIICVNVGALRYACYMGAQDLVVGVEDYEQEGEILRLYDYINVEKFKKLPVIGNNGEQYNEAIISANPEVIFMKTPAKEDAEKLQNKTGIPVVAIPGSDTALDESEFETIKIYGEALNKQDRAKELTEYLNNIKADLNNRTKDIKDEDKPSVYIGCVSFKGHHGFEGTEANYGPLKLINANNLADTTDQKMAFNIDTEKVLKWDPDYIFLDFNGIPMLNDDYKKNPGFYNSLTAVKEGRVYSQISFRSYAANLDTALADAYYAGTIIYPEQFKDVDPVKKAGEIFEFMLGENPYNDLKESGYEFRALTLGK